MCTEQNSRCVLYNHSRGKEGRVKEDYCQNFPAFLLSARVSTSSRLPCQTGSLPVSPSSLILPFSPSFLCFGSPESGEALLCRLQENVGHLFFCSSLHFNRRKETGAITSFSAFVSPSPSLPHLPCLDETLQGLPKLYLCPL